MTRVFALAALVAAMLSVSWVAGVSAQTAKTRTQVATLGAWRAKLTSTVEIRGGFAAVTAVQLRMLRDGAKVFDKRVALPGACAGGGCTFIDLKGFSTLDLRAFAGPEPTAVIWLYTGGAHCCTVVQTVSLPEGLVEAHDFGNAGAVLIENRGETLFLTADDRFSYRYTSYAASARPLQILRLTEKGFEDVTPAYPRRLRSDARVWWKDFKRARAQGVEARGLFAAWAADSCRLGKRVEVVAQLAGAVAAGAFSPPNVEPGGPVGAAYSSILSSDLARLGYCRTTS